MDRFFSLFHTAASCSKWNKIRLGPRFVRCLSGHRPWTSVRALVCRFLGLKFGPSPNGKKCFFSQFQMKNSQSDQVHLVPENLSGFGCKWVENVVNNRDFSVPFGNGSGTCPFGENNNILLQIGNFHHLVRCLF